MPDSISAKIERSPSEENKFRHQAVDYRPVKKALESLAKAENTEHALRLLDAAVRASKQRGNWRTYDHFIVLKAALLIKTKRRKQAIETLEECVKTHERDNRKATVNVYAMLASALEKNRDFSGAALAFAAAYKSAPNQQIDFARGLLKNLFYSQHKAAFVQAADKMADNHIEDPFVQLWYVVALRLQGHDLEANRLLNYTHPTKAFIRKNPKAIEIAFGLTANFGLVASTEDIFDPETVGYQITEVIDPDLEKTYGIETGLVV